MKLTTEYPLALGIKEKHEFSYLAKYFNISCMLSLIYIIWSNVKMHLSILWSLFTAEND